MRQTHALLSALAFAPACSAFGFPGYPAPPPATPPPSDDIRPPTASNRIMNVYSTVCGVKPDDTLYCIPGVGYGDNLNADTFAQSLAVKQLVGQYNRKIAVVTKSGSLYYWSDFATVPSHVLLDVGGEVDQAWLSHFHMCGLLVSGSVRCWGGSTAQNGGSSITGPNLDFGIGVKALKLSGRGDGGTCAIVEKASSCQSRLMCWGKTDSSTPSCIDIDSPPGIGARSYVGSSSDLYAVDISGGWNHVCAILNNDKVVCWGSDTQSSVSGLPSNLPLAAKIASGSYSGCILPKPLGSAKPICWGKASNFGDVSSLTFNPVDLTSQGYSHCFISATDSVTCLGSEASDDSWAFPDGFKVRPA